MPGGLFGLEERRIRGPRALGERARLLESRGLSVPGGEELVLGLYEGETLRATGALVGESLQGIAVDGDLEGSGVAAAIVSALLKAGMESGRRHFFLFTKPREAGRFSDLGFLPVAKVPDRGGDEGVVLLEWGEGTIDSWIAGNAPSEGLGRSRTGAVVVNCNPFTLGHRALVEYAASKVERLYVFVVQEDRSVFPFSVRIDLVRRGTADLQAVRVLPGGPYVISQATFPTYFLKPDSAFGAQGGRAVRLHASLDLAIFRSKIAPGFGIGTRFVGTEPFCPTTSAYNRLMGEILSAPYIEGPPLALDVLPRLEKEGAPVSASAVRALIREGSLDKVASLVPPATYEWLRSESAAPVIEKIRSGETRH